MERAPVREFIRHHYRHFNAAALVRASESTYTDAIKTLGSK